MISGRGGGCGAVEPIDDTAVPSLSSEVETRTLVRQWRPKYQPLWLMEARLEDVVRGCSNNGPRI